MPHLNRPRLVTSLGVPVRTGRHIINAGGIFIQLMPGTGEDDISWLEKWLSYAARDKLLEPGKRFESIMEEVLPEENWYSPDYKTRKVSVQLFEGEDGKEPPEPWYQGIWRNWLPMGRNRSS